MIDEFKNQIIGYQNKINKLQVLVEDSGKKERLKINEIIDFSTSTNNSKFTKTFIQAHP